jgi:predicted O-methyltransferase YrrM/lysophospholipase L1-like esterase
MTGSRTIRFKEWGVLVAEMKSPTQAYLDVSDSSLGPGPFTLRTDSEGFIRTGNQLENRGAMKKIVMIGDSFVESLFVDEKDRFCSNLERQLNHDGLTLECLNAGYSGSTLLHSFNVFMNKVVPLIPYTRRILIFTAMSDVRTLRRKQSYWAQDRTHAPIVEERNRTVGFDRDPSTEQMQPLLETFIQAVRAFGQEPIIVGTPFRSGDYDEDHLMKVVHKSREEFLASQLQMKMINQAARKIATAMGVHFIDAEQALEGKFELFYDNLHLNAAGQKVMANFLFDALGRVLKESPVQAEEPSVNLDAWSDRLDRQIGPVKAGLATVESRISEQAWAIRGASSFSAGEVDAIQYLRTVINPPRYVPPAGGWAATYQSLAYLVNEVLSAVDDPRILELGSGVSSVWVGLALSLRGGGSLISIEHDTMYFDRTRDLIQKHDLEDFVEIRLAPITQAAGALWYQRSVVTRDLEGITLVFVDGPPSNTGTMARLPAFQVLAPHLSDDALILLDDIDREDEQRTADQWSESCGPNELLEQIATIGRTLVLQFTRSRWDDCEGR